MSYQYRGFKIVNQKIDKNTSEEEYTMEWNRYGNTKKLVFKLVGGIAKSHQDEKDLAAAVSFMAGFYILYAK